MRFCSKSSLKLTSCCMAMSLITTIMAASNGGSSEFDSIFQEDMLFFANDLSLSMPPNQPPSKSPSSAPTPICHDQKDFLARIGGVTIRCYSIQNEANRIKYCNLKRMNRTTRERQPIKYFCPEACAFDCSPTEAPSKSPSEPPTKSPTDVPTKFPTKVPSETPSQPPTNRPTDSPTKPPTGAPTEAPSQSPSEPPTKSPTDVPTKFPTKVPSETPSQPPTNRPTDSPTKPQTGEPTEAPSQSPSEPPTKSPTDVPTKFPTEVPSETPTNRPTGSPTNSPTESPSEMPSSSPTPLCHDIGTFAFSVGGISYRCDSIQTQVDIDQFCNLPRRYSGGPLLPIKYFCPEACEFDCAPTHSPSEYPTQNPSQDPSESPSEPTFICEALATKNYAEYEEKVKEIYRTVSGQNAFDGTDPDRMDALNFILDEGLCVDPPRMIQRYISALFYYSTEGETWEESVDWVSPKHECDWNGIECNDDLIITRINRDDNTLRGTLAFELCDLPLLNRLDLDSNQIGGSIPDDIGRCQNLVSYDLDSNNLTGSIPESIFNIQGLRSIDLDTNNLTGTLSRKFGNLVDLSYLSLFRNQFRGTIPVRMSLLKNLQIAYLEFNDFTGAVAKSICDNLKTKDKGGNLQALNTDCGGPNPEVSCVCCTQCFG
mmetsp:Transcript_32016/g.73654  ORF Transcript_32016/g.73654 Transcript_32016/m.73654 type:complete len:654 (-) Transcript_32016:329-2290(-)